MATRLGSLYAALTIQRMLRTRTRVAQLCFAAEDSGYLGVAPRYAEVGDELYGFWNVSSMALIRKRSSSRQFVGRAATLSSQKRGDWFVPRDGLRGFLDPKSSTLDVKVSLKALTKLSVDTVMLPYTD